MMLQMSAMMREGGGGGGNPFGAVGGAGGFPAPGTPGGTVSPVNPTAVSPPAQGMAPFASMFGPGAGTGGASPAGAGFDPAMMQQLFGMGAGAGNPFGGSAATAPPADTRPPEERFQVQLQVR
jgi:ubiquilin